MTSSKGRKKTLHFSFISSSIMFLGVAAGLLAHKYYEGFSYATVPTPTVLSSTAVAMVGFSEKEPNNTWDNAKANGYISLSNGTVYLGTFDGSTTIGSDNWYISFSGASTTRTFTLNPANTSGVQLVLYHFPAGGVAVPVASDLTSPFSVTYTFTTAGDYELVVHADPTKSNTSSYLFTVTDPNVAAKCPWLGPTAATVLPGSGTVLTFSEYIIGSTLFQTFWRGTQGWARSVPISNNVRDFSKASAWTGPSALTTVGGTGTLQAHTESAVGSTLYQTVIRGDQIWSRYVPIVNNAPQLTCAN